MRTYLASDAQTYSARTVEGAARQAYGRTATPVQSLTSPFAWAVYAPDMTFLGDLWEQ